MKKNLIFFLFFTIFSYTNDFGIFIGEKHIEKLYNYNTVVIDAMYYSKNEIKYLKSKNIKVYSYINIGSIEEFRPYYKKFKSKIIKKYDNWNNEFWIDVTDKGWKEHIKIYANELAKKNIDGFFVDNADIYYIYKNKKVYNSIVDILKILKKHKLKVMINGADTFVKDAMKQENIKELIDSANQENVFTVFDFKIKKFLKQKAETKNYYLKYLSKLKNIGIDVYMTEYCSDDEISRKDIIKYAKENNYHLYISNDIELR